MDDPIGDALGSRRIPHSRQGKAKSSRGGRSSKPFDPLMSLGRYKLQIGSRNTDARVSQADRPASWMEIHELTPGEDGLVGTFSIEEKLSGILILAGSRKGLASIVEDLESAASSGNDDQSDSEDTAKSSADEEASPRFPQSSLEAEDDRINRRAKAFEKNSFRNPKFWLRWQGKVRSAGAFDDAEEALDSDVGYLIFSSNDFL
ncbi:Catalase [Teratosphaeria destructans]|uniref:Catalase n=1 Tax=Teratosphaeria destructans TaxID=418781 RepID=A0A9W7SPQ4_9PEZI|nr:Catalase [Teratosphaeria destructans]